MDSIELTGANVADLRALAQSFDRSADRLSQAAQQIGATIADPRSWGGRDADRFRSTFASTTRPSLGKVSGDLHAAAAQLRKEAAEQETASAANGGAGIGELTATDVWETTAFGVEGATSAVSWVGTYSNDVTGWLAEAKVINSKEAEGFADSFSSVGKWADGVGGVFAFASAAQEANGLGSALAEHDTNAEWEQGTKLLSDTINTFPFLKAVPPLGALSAAGDSYQFGEALGSGDTGMAIDKGVSIAGTGLLVAAPFTGPAAPFVAGAGIALSVGSQAYEHRAQIEAVANTTWNAVSDLAKTEASGLAAIGSSLGNSSLARTLW